jgi:hypothetical protein
MCGWCNLNKDTMTNKAVQWDRINSNGDSASLVFTDKELQVIVERDGVEELAGSVQINFCSICGRELRGRLYRSDPENTYYDVVTSVKN